MSDLIDTAEMYLRTIFELEEEGITPMRARIAERLGQSGPTVSQTVARMERDGLVTVAEDRHLELTANGRAAATRVMRKHRLAECLLVDVIGVPLADVHAEACRWEHVISDSVERRLLEVLGNPTRSPFGNPIPGLAELDPSSRAAEAAAGVPLDEAADDTSRRFVVRRIGEPAQSEPAAMEAMHRGGVAPGAIVTAQRTDAGIRVVAPGRDPIELTRATAGHVIVEAAP